MPGESCAGRAGGGSRGQYDGRRILVYALCSWLQVKCIPLVKDEDEFPAERSSRFKDKVEKVRSLKESSGGYLLSLGFAGKEFSLVDDFGFDEGES